MNSRIIKGYRSGTPYRKLKKTVQWLKNKNLKVKPAQCRIITPIQNLENYIRINHPNYQEVLVPLTLKPFKMSQ